ncbi:DctP family TRAP transporter solute-binding subunit [Parvularcula sp. IMCC14364]|uniref:DctP family TRAP transporter solute-binding subunit n=1 Tax=Parvularcula sp. IMCC14364 TaxID=3067902 RepID=UPI0027403C69|nr:DctP family TRAP transporter solute-binding subunit [Parvularcula sp. IMCC14364]
MRGLVRTIIFILISAALVSPAAAQRDITIRLAHVDGAEWQKSKKGAAAEIFKNIVENETDITVQLFPAKALGDEDDLVQQAQEGTAQIVIVSAALSKLCKPAYVLDIPYTFTSAPVAWDVLDGPFGAELAATCLERTGLRTLAFGETGFRNFTNSKRPVKTPADLKGLKIRVQPIPLYIEMVKALGAEPTPIAWSELPNALTTGVADGQENPVGTIYNNNLHKLQDYMILDGHNYAVDFILINDEFYQYLPEKDRAVVARAARIAGTMSRAIQQFNTAESLSTVIEEGMEVHVPTQEELGQFRARARPAVIAWLEQELGDDADWITRLEAAVSAASD